MYFSFYPIRFILSKLKRDHVSAYAGLSAYFTVLSFLPFLMFLLTLIQRLPIHLESIFSILDYVVPEIYIPAFRTLFYDIKSNTSNTTFSLSIILTIWTAAKGILALSSGLNSVYQLNENKSYLILRLKSMFYTLSFAVIIIITTFILIFGENIYNKLAKMNFYLPRFLYWITSLRTCIAFIIFFFICALFYTFLPSHRQLFRYQLIGAAFTSFTWMLSSGLFSLYLNIGYSGAHLYGSLSYAIAFLLYLYVFMYLFFIGAEINHFFITYVFDPAD